MPEESNDDSPPSVGPLRPYDAMPRWVKLLWVLVAVVVVLFLVLLLSGGNHGPGRHLGSAGAMVTWR